MTKRLFLVEIDTTDAVSDIGEDVEVMHFIKEVVTDGFGPAFLDEAPVRVMPPSGRQTRNDDPHAQWLRFPE